MMKEKIVKYILTLSLGIVSISLLYSNELLLFIFLLCFYMSALKLFPSDRQYLLFASIVGSIGEIVCVNFGVWRYTNSSLLGIPLWLPLAWGLGVLWIKRFTEILQGYISAKTLK